MHSDRFLTVKSFRYSSFTDEILDELAEDIAVEPEIQNIELPTDDSANTNALSKINFNECVILQISP